MPTVAIVTGYASGLGYCLSEELLKNGWTVIGVARRSRAATLEAGYPDRVHAVAGSVAEDETADRAFAVAAELGGARLVVNCAGVGCFGTVGSHTAADIAAAIEANLAGLILFSDRAVTHLGDGGGDIVNVMSTAAKKLRPEESVYTAVKWGAKAYTRTLRAAVKEKHLPIRVFEVYPCGMKTAFWNTAIRPITDGAAFPDPGPIATTIVDALSTRGGSYPLEMTFERD